MNKIKIIDAPMGFGKTTMAVQLMNEDVKNNYIYITPFLKEVQRIKDGCKDRKFYEPMNIGTGKLDSLHELLKNNKNIASTHALFQMSTEVTRDLIQANNYILILDEVCNVIDQVPLKKDDLGSILEYSHIEEGFLIWDAFDYEGRYNDIKRMSINHTVIVVDDHLLMWNLPVEVFKSFKECYIMTYMFDAQIQKYYYDLYGLECEYFSVTKRGDSYTIIPLSEFVFDKTDIRNKIHILEDDIINNIGEKETALSVKWFESYNNKPLVDILQKNIYNYFHNKVDSKSKDVLWTTFKKSKGKLSGGGFARGFLACNARATNEYRDRVYIAYCVNIFLNPMVKQFFEDRGVSVEQDGYALSEMIQWIWRSAIRDDKDIYCYIPSKRMRTLLNDWLNS